MAEPGVITLAPARRRAAWAATQQYLFLPVFGGLLAGAAVGSAMHAKARHTSGLAVGVGIVVGALLYGLLIWRAQGIELVIDRNRASLTIRNLVKTYVVTARDMGDIEEGEEVISRGRYGSITRAPCLKIDTRGGRRIWIQASLRNGDDKSLADALESFCRDNSVRCLFTPADT